MILIEQERCTGCGACLEACPRGALYLLEGKAVVDEALCRECALCVAACPEGAIRLAEAPAPAEAAPLPAVQTPSPVVPVQVKPAPLAVPLRKRVLPVVGAALAWTAREIGPVLADYLVHQLEQRRSGSQKNDQCRGDGGGGRRRRRRRRGA